MPSSLPRTAPFCGWVIATARVASVTVQGGLVPVSPLSSVPLPTIMFAPVTRVMLAKEPSSSSMRVPSPGGVVSTHLSTARPVTRTRICTPLAGLASMSSSGVTVAPQRAVGWNVVTNICGGWVSTKMVLVTLVVMFASFVTEAWQVRELSAHTSWPQSVTSVKVAVGVPPLVATAVSAPPPTSQPVRVTVLPAQAAPI